VSTIAGIFKAYDIRGIVDETLNEEIAYAIGRAYVLATGTAGKTLLIGHDMRPSSLPYSEALIRGITDQGANVVDAGLVSTPLFYFATKEYAGGIIVTASHNPKEWNGFKFCKEQAIPISYDTGIQKIEELVAKNTFPDADKGTVEKHDFMHAFIDYNLSFLKATTPRTIVVDAGNGMGGHTYQQLEPKLAERGITMIPLFFEPDGTFPNHEANPLKEETLKLLKQTVKAKQAAFGLALDGDGDRCVFIDETGETVRADLFTGLIAEELLKEQPGSLILYDLRSSRAVRELIEAAGGQAKMCRVGHAFIKAQMREEGAVLAGELSGHFYPGEVNYTENTMYALFKLLNLMEETGKSLHELIQPLRKYSFSGEINSTVDDADTVLQHVEEKYATSEAVDITKIDGIRVEFKEWWLSVRKSNTEPVVRLIVEADSQELMEAKRDELLALIRK
jgi:phosphomannomutase